MIGGNGSLGGALALSDPEEAGEGAPRVMAAWLPPSELPTEIATRSSDDPYCFVVDLPAVLRATEELLEGEGALANWRKAVFMQLDAVLSL